MRPAISDRGYTEKIKPAVFSALRDWRKSRIEKYGEALLEICRDYNTSVDFLNLRTFARKFEQQPETGDPQIDHKRTLSSGSVSVGMGRGSYGRYGGVGYNTGVSECDQAILTIDILSPADEKIIWRGVGSRSAYAGSSPAKATKIVNESVSKS